MITVDKEKLQQARAILDAGRYARPDSAAEPFLEFLSDFCRKVYFALHDEGAVLIKQEENMTKEEKQDLVQKAALKAWKEGGEWGLLAMATGTGKSKVAIEAVTSLLDAEVLPGFIPNILLIVPTEKLRDNNWEEEFVKWKAHDAYDWLDRSCYASMLNYENQVFDLVILDKRLLFN